MKIYRASAVQVLAYHGSDVLFDSFDSSYTAQGVFWFTENIDKIINGEIAGIGGRYIYKVLLSVDNIAGWDEYDNKFLEEIRNDGFDSIQLDDDWIVFDASRIKIEEVYNHEDI